MILFLWHRTASEFTWFFHFFSRAETFFWFTLVTTFSGRKRCWKKLKESACKLCSSIVDSFSPVHPFDLSHADPQSYYEERGMLIFQESVKKQQNRPWVWPVARAICTTQPQLTSLPSWTSFSCSSNRPDKVRLHQKRGGTRGLQTDFRLNFQKKIRKISAFERAFTFCIVHLAESFKKKFQFFFCCNFLVQIDFMNENSVCCHFCAEVCHSPFLRD